MRIDDDNQSVISTIEAILGSSSLPETAAQFASSGKKPFQHHLLLRYLYFCNCSTRDVSVDAYLESYEWSGKAVCGSDHPWELIEVYRALLQFERRDDKRACAHFRRAITLVVNASGVVVLVRAMISTVALCCFTDPAFQESAEGSLDSAERELNSSEAMRVIQSLRMICREPAPARVSEALSVLPFNYH